MTPSDGGKRIAKSRIRQIFEFLKALNDNRNPAVRQIKEQTWFMWLDDLPDHPSIELPICTLQTHDATSETAPAHRDDYRFRVRRPTLTQSPSPPTEIRDWLRDGWNDPDNDVQFLETRNEIGSDGESVTVRFDDEPNRLAARTEWQQRRDVWRLAELPARKAMHVFEKIYALHGQLKRESERLDLVIGDGLLSWQQTDGNIYHPLLLQRVQLEFDPRTPEFTILDADSKSELYASLFHVMPGVNPSMLAARREEFELAGYHPLSVEANAFLESLVNQLSSQGSFTSDRRPEPGTKNPSVGRGPVLFLRSRTKGFGNAITQVLESVESREDFCDALYSIVDCTPLPSKSHENKALETTNTDLAQMDVLFGKEANLEQFEIARQLNQHGAVIVQGPPGTGKSHTIANLIGHLLAQGKSVLVTSHTTKALRVLRGHIVEELRPLCVSVLESDLDSRKQLEESVQTISNRLNQANPDELEKDAARLSTRRQQLLEVLQQHKKDLCNARADEYRSIVIAGKEYAPSDAARIVAAGAGKHDWMPSPIALGAPLPLSILEIQELYATNTSTLPEDEKHADKGLPNEQRILSPAEIDRLLEGCEKFADAGNWEHQYWAKATLNTRHIVDIQQLEREFRDLLDGFQSLTGWSLVAVDAGRNEATRGPWKQLLAKIEETRKLNADAQLDFVKHRPEVTNESALANQIATADTIRNHLAGGGKLSWLRLWWSSHWKVSLQAWRVHDRIPNTSEELTAVGRLLHVKMARNELEILWNGLIAPNEGPCFIELGAEPENAADQFAVKIQDCLQWWDQRFTPLIVRLREVGFDWDSFLGQQPPDLGKHGAIRRMVNAIELRLLKCLEETSNHLRMLNLKGQLNELLKILDAYQRPETAELQHAINARDAQRYRLAYARCLEAAERRRHVLRRRELLATLERRTASGIPLAQRWASSIRNRVAPHDAVEPPGDVLAAWEWRQLNDELQRRAQVNIEELGQKIEGLRRQIKELTIQLIDRLAWARQLRRTTPHQRQALMGWLQTINRIGKGFGIRVPQLRRAAQQKMEECRDAVPIWVMPIARIVENFDFKSPRFDVVIIDEASQCDAMSLLALAIAKKVVVVGDDKQVSPLAVGKDQQNVEKLISLHLEGIPNAHLYDGRQSIYDLAKRSFPGMICLLEHFRCVSQIIHFSNHLSYDGMIQPLREDAKAAIRPAVVPYRVEGDYDVKRKVNREEALVVASVVAAANEHRAFTGLTFGVISLLGEEQAAEIERLLLRQLRPEEYERRRIVCGNSAQFQGDERDVMFLSMVQSAKDGPLPMLDSDAFRQRFNVAASRARDQLWIVHSLSPETDLKPGDIRRRLIEHALDPTAITRELEKASQRTESVFEREVMERLIRRGYRVKSQWPVGSFRIDLVVQGAMGRLAIECDGDRYHPIEKLPEDMERQAILERLGWRFLRLRGSTYFRDKDGAMEAVFLRLKEMGIEPEGTDEKPRADNCEATGLVQNVIRRAAEIRANWQTSKNNAKNPDSATMYG